jgi:hypothetical protein
VRTIDSSGRIQIAGVHGVWPFFAFSNQSSAHRIFADICHFFIKALVTPASMIEEISLPGDVRDSSRDPLKIADQT